MPIFPLDAVRNSTINYEVELVLEDVREDVARFPFSRKDDSGDVEDMLAVYDLARPRMNVLLSQLLDLRDAVGVDISAGIGFLPVVLLRAGLRTVATERHPSLCRFAAKHGIEVHEYHIGRTSPPFATCSLDFLVFAEVLEHLKIPAVAVIRELASLLRPGGRLLLTTPNVARLAHIEALVAGENFLEPFPENIPPGSDATDFVEHVREYSVREAIEAVEATGLTIEHVLMTGWGESGYDLLPNPYCNEILVVVARAL